MYTKMKEKDQTKATPVYDQNKDITSVLHQIVVDMKEETDQGMYNKWNIPWKDLKNCQVKVRGEEETLKVDLLVFELHGGFRVPATNTSDLQARAKDTKKLLSKFEKALRKEFKARTGKNLRLSNGKERVDFELVAPNGLYRFWAIKQADIGVDLGGQEYPESLADK